MDLLAAAISNLTDPAVLAFVVGVLATLKGADLRLPDPVVTAITTYLLLGIGIKGGAALRASTAVSTVGVGAGVGRAAGVGTADRGLAGSVGAAANPAYLGGGGRVDLGGALRHAVGERSILLLVGGLAIGALGGARGLEQVKPFFVDLFPGILTLFLLQMGTLAGRHLADLRDVGARLVGLAVAVPLVNGVLGALVGRAAGLSLGGATVLACMAASASYIAAPAAVRLALPDANPGYYLTAAIGVTFPFNVAIGIPLYHGVAQLLY